MSSALRVEAGGSMDKNAEDFLPEEGVEMRRDGRGHRRPLIFLQKSVRVVGISGGCFGETH